jgi:hypothetical protein
MIGGPPCYRWSPTNDLYFDMSLKKNPSYRWSPTNDLFVLGISLLSLRIAQERVEHLVDYFLFLFGEFLNLLQAV